MKKSAKQRSFRAAKVERAGPDEDQLRAQFEANKGRLGHVLRFGSAREVERALKAHGASPLSIELVRLYRETGSTQIEATIDYLLNNRLWRDDWKAALNRRPKEQRFDERRRQMLARAMRKEMWRGKSKRMAAQIVSAKFGTYGNFDDSTKQMLSISRDDPNITALNTMSLRERRQKLPAADTLVNKIAAGVKQIFDAAISAGYSAEQAAEMSTKVVGDAVGIAIRVERVGTKRPPE